MKNIFSLITIAIFLLLSFSQQSLFSQSPDRGSGRPELTVLIILLSSTRKNERKIPLLDIVLVAPIYMSKEIMKHFREDWGLVWQLETKKEKRSMRKFYFIHGIEPYTNLNIAAFDGGGVRASVILGIGYVLGFQYNFSKEFYVNLETIPSLSTNFIISEDGLSDNFNLGGGFNSNIAAISFVYRFKKPK